ncbi:MAG: sigma-70 family RNA polymerase sigma factor [Planctomycetes bacterium]|nr:sigma-70 family RNA polymerase sigma factor [Planctomycetota bacterium]
MKNRVRRDPSEGDQDAAASLLPEVYDELRRLAGRYLNGTIGTLQPTALVHEAYLKCDAHRFRDRAHFKAVAATAMRQVLLDHVRRKRAQKRGDEPIQTCCNLDEVCATPVDLLALDDALQALAALDARKARVVELRVFSGMTIEETAAALEVSDTTVSKDWRFARAWLATQLTGEAPPA